MGLRKAFLLGMVSALVLVGCAGFSYRYYGMFQVVYEQGKLLGPNPNEDLPFSKCAPSTSSNNPCVVMFTPEFMAFKQDYLDMQQKLKECQKP